MFIIGACVGSFLCCQARRLHHRSTSKGKRSSKFGRRSVCMHCKKQLKWYDNLPIISWLMLRGRCRHCHKKIGAAELLSEVFSSIAFLILSFTVNPATALPLDWIIFGFSIILMSTFIFLAIYDGIYGELPTLCLVLSIVCAAIIAALKFSAAISISGFSPALILDPIFAIAILGGLYLILYIISKGKWVGDGDWLLGHAIAIALGTPWLALIALFLSHFLACLVMYPLIKSSKPSKSTRRKSAAHKIHLGPFLVAAFILVYSFADFFNVLID